MSEILLKIGGLKIEGCCFVSAHYIKGICEMENQESANYTYILRCKDDSLYTGWTNNLEKRIQNHNAGKGAKYTRARRPVELVYYERFLTRQEAMRREWEIKQLARKDKLKLIEKNFKNILD